MIRSPLLNLHSIVLDRWYSANERRCAGSHVESHCFSPYSRNSILLSSLIEILPPQLPEEEIKGVYEPEDQYAFYRDLSSPIETATAVI